MVLDALRALKSLQSEGKDDIPKGNFPSLRHHPVLKVSRTEDNVYFVSWIAQVLKRLEELMTAEERSISEGIRTLGEESIIRYRSRYGQVSYNFYRPEQWFPNGTLLHRFKTFQPTDDADDSCIAFRGFSHPVFKAETLKDMMLGQANGEGGKYLKRGPSAFRRHLVYNTWIGSRNLFVDMDLSVICNVLMFNAQYDLGKNEVDKGSVALLVESVKEGYHLSETWSIAAWYPFPSVILYGLADLISTGYYPELESIKDIVVRDLKVYGKEDNPIESQLRNSSLMKVGESPEHNFEIQSIPEFLEMNKDFSFGVIPILHPFNGRLAQWLSSFPFFRFLYRCDAQVLAILIEHELLRRRF